MPGPSTSPAAPKRARRIKITPAQKEAEAEGPLNKHWRTYFLQALAATSNVAAAAKHAGATTSRAYKVRREDPVFARQWRDALTEGYEHLEMEVLAYLRGQDGGRKLDVANAIRLLAAHRQTVAEIRAAQEDTDERAVLKSIDALIDRMRREDGPEPAARARNKRVGQRDRAGGADGAADDRVG